MLEWRYRCWLDSSAKDWQEMLGSRATHTDSQGRTLLLLSEIVFVAVSLKFSPVRGAAWWKCKVRIVHCRTAGARLLPVAKKRGKNEGKSHLGSSEAGRIKEYPFEPYTFGRTSVHFYWSKINLQHVKISVTIVLLFSFRPRSPPHETCEELRKKLRASGTFIRLIFDVSSWRTLWILSKRVRKPLFWWVQLCGSMTEQLL